VRIYSRNGSEAGTVKLIREVCRACRRIEYWNPEDDENSDPYMPEVKALSDGEFNYRWDKRGTMLCPAMIKIRTTQLLPLSDEQEQPPWGYIRITDDVPEKCPYVAEHAVAQEKP